MSAGRSRSGGSSIAKTWMRKKKSCRKRPEATSSSRSRWVAVTRRKSTGIGWFPPTRTTCFSWRTRRRLDLDLRRDVADLVQEERPLVGELDLAAAARSGARERPLLVPEELALEDPLGEGAAVHDAERPEAPRAPRVDEAGDELLAGAALPGDEDARVGRGDLVDELEDLLHRPAPGRDEGRLGRLEARLQLAVLGEERVALGRLLHEARDRLGVERLDDVVVGAVLERLDGRLDRCVGRHDDDGRLGGGLADLAEDLETVHPGHLDVDEEDLRRLARERRERLAAARRGEDVVPLLLEPERERAPQVGLVVDDHQLHGRGHQGSSPGAAVPGRVTRNRVPAPGELSTSIAPPCRWTMP